MPEVNEFGQQVGDVVPGWTPHERPRPLTLTGRYVVVEPLGPEHLGQLYDALCGVEDRSLWTYRATGMPESLEELAGALADPDVLTFVLRPGAGAARGIASYARIDPATGQVEVAGVLYARSLQRTAAATEAIHLLMRYAFEELGYRRFEWKCDSLNEPSRRAAARLGFTYEGRFRHHLVVKGRNRDTDWFSVTDAQWPGVRAEHERWLAPDNFDPDGGQRTPLRVAG